MKGTVDSSEINCHGRAVLLSGYPRSTLLYKLKKSQMIKALISSITVVT